MGTHQTRSAALPEIVAGSLRERIERIEWEPGQMLPSESELAADYAVSRHTMRVALKQMQRAGLVETRHGLGTFVTRYSSSISAGLQELRSMHEIIRQQGREAGSVHRISRLRPATDDEARTLECPAGTPVVELEREITADGRTVAFDYSVILAAALGVSREDDLAGLRGSMFDHFAGTRHLPERAVARVRAVLEPTVGWGNGRSSQGLYLLLDQIQFVPGGTPTTWSRIYFLDDGFEFLLVRHGD